MSLYKKPTRESLEYNSSYFETIDSSASSTSASDSVLTYGNQVISGIKDFISSTNFSDINSSSITVGGSTYLKDLSLTGNSTIGDVNTDTCNINAVLNIKNSVVIGTSENTDLLSIYCNEQHYGTSVFGGLTNFNGTSNFYGGINLTGSMTAGDMASDILTVNSSTTLKNNVIIGDVSTDVLTVNSVGTYNNTSNFVGSVLIKNNSTIGETSTDICDVYSTLNIKNSVVIGTSEGTDLLSSYCNEQHYGTCVFNGASNFIGAITTTGSMTVADAISDTLIVNASTTLKNSVTIGDASTDTLVVNSLSSFNNTETHLSIENHYGVETHNGVSNFIATVSAPLLNCTSLVNTGNSTLGNDSLVDTTTFNSLLVCNGAETHAGTVTFNGSVYTTGNMIISDMSSDTLVVNASTTLKNNVIIGDISTDVLTINSIETHNGTTSFNGIVNFNGNVVLGNAQLDTVTITSDSNFSNNVICGSSATDTLTTNSTSTFHAPTTFNSTATFNGAIVSSETIDSIGLSTYTESQVVSANFDTSTSTGFTIVVEPYFKRAITVSMPVSCYRSGLGLAIEGIQPSQVTSKFNSATVVINKNGVNFNTNTTVLSTNGWSFEKNFTISNNNAFTLEQYMTNLYFTFYPSATATQDTYTCVFTLLTGTTDNILRLNGTTSFYKTSNVSSSSNTGSNFTLANYTLAYYQFVSNNDEITECNTIISTNAVIQNLNVLGSAYLKSTSTKVLTFDGDTGQLRVQGGIVADIESSALTFSTINTKTDVEFGDLFTRTTTLESDMLTKQNIINSSNRLNTNLLGNGQISNNDLYSLVGINTIVTIQEQLDLLLPSNSGIMTGTPTCPTAIESTNNTQIANTAFVKTQIANLVGTASSTLDTLGEISTALAGNANFSTTITELIATKAPSIDPTLVCNTLSITPTLLSYLNGCSSNLQTQLNGKQATLTGSSNLVIGTLQSTSILDNGNLTVKGLTTIGDQITDSCTFFTGMTINGLTKSTVGLANVDNTSDANKPISSATQTALDAKTTLSTIQSNNNTFTGSNILQNVLSISENIGSGTVSAGAVSLNYATSAVFLITNTSSATNFTVNLTNVNGSSLLNKTFNITLLINASTYKMYCNVLNVNGTARTMIYNNGSANIPALTSATHIIQNINIIYTSSSTIPTLVITNVSPYF